MKTLLSASLALLLAAPVTYGAGEQPKSEPRQPTMAEQAAAARAKRKKSGSKVITNADVEKSRGRIIENSGEMTPVEAAPTETLTEKQAAEKTARSLADARLTAAKQLVADLEKEVAGIEQQYYEENDLDRRDGDIVRRFNDASSRLAAARKELEALLPPTTPE